MVAIDPEEPFGGEGRETENITNAETGIHYRYSDCYCA